MTLRHFITTLALLVAASTDIAVPAARTHGARAR